MGRVHLFCALCLCAARVVFLLFRGGVVFAPRICLRGSFLFGVVALWRRLSLLLLFLLPVPLRSLVWAHVYFRLGRWGRMLGWRCGHLLLLLLLLLSLSLSWLARLVVKCPRPPRRGSNDSGTPSTPPGGCRCARAARMEKQIARSACHPRRYKALAEPPMRPDCHAHKWRATHRTSRDRDYLKGRRVSVAAWPPVHNRGGSVMVLAPEQSQAPRHFGSEQKHRQPHGATAREQSMQTQARAPRRAEQKRKHEKQREAANSKQAAEAASSRQQAGSRVNEKPIRSPPVAGRKRQQAAG